MSNTGTSGSPHAAQHTRHHRHHHRRTQRQPFIVARLLPLPLPLPTRTSTRTTAKPHVHTHNCQATRPHACRALQKAQLPSHTSRAELCRRHEAEHVLRRRGLLEPSTDFDGLPRAFGGLPRAFLAPSAAFLAPSAAFLAPSAAFLAPSAAFLAPSAAFLAPSSRLRRPSDDRPRALSTAFASAQHGASHRALRLEGPLLRRRVGRLAHRRADRG